MKAIALLRDSSGEWMVIKPEAGNVPPNELGTRDFFVSRRYFVEKPEAGILAGEDVFMPPHWISMTANWAIRIDWFSEPKEITITELTNATH